LDSPDTETKENGEGRKKGDNTRKGKGASLTNPTKDARTKDRKSS